MVRSPCCEVDANVRKGPWSEEEDKKLMDYIAKNGAGNWRHLPKCAGLNRWGKSCRLRWTNYLRPDIKRGTFTEEEERLIIHLHSILGNKWSAIAAQLRGRTDNEIKNHWNTHIRKKLLMMGIDPVTHMPRTDHNLLANLPILIAVASASNVNNFPPNPLINNANMNPLPNFPLLQNLIQTITYGSTPSHLHGMGQLESLPFVQQNLNPTIIESNILMNGNDHLVVPLNNGRTTTSFMNTPNSTTSLASASPEYLSVDNVLDDPWN